jgi:hypothetical protein
MNAWGKFCNVKGGIDINKMDAKFTTQQYPLKKP